MITRTYGENRKNLSNIQIAVIGNFRREEFVPVVDDIGNAANAIYFENILTFLYGNENQRNYDLIFLLESSFAQYSLYDFQKLQDFFPLTRVVLIAGSLAEGEKRTGNLPSHVFRYYFHQLQTEISQQLTAFCQGQSSVWNLPPTSSDEERLAKSFSMIEKENDFQKSPSSVLVIASDSAMRDFLLDFSKKNGATVFAVNPYDLKNSPENDFSKNLTENNFPEIPTEILFDIFDEDFHANLEIIKLLRKKWSSFSTRLTLYCNAPRADEIRVFRENGVQRVISKPFFVV